MLSKFRYRAPIVALGIMLLTVTVFGAVIDETDPEIKDRVARISHLTGDVDIRRADADESEKAVLNLPIVQGDVIVTGTGARFEIQFSSRKYLRVSENSQITITTLQETGLAISVLRGTAAFRTIDFDKESEFVEIDAPKTTVAIQRSGHYVVDAGANGDVVRVTVTEDGEARVYSETSGFTLRDGRSAQLFVGGNRPGEWDIADASDFETEFYAWSLDRDKTIAARLRDAHYDRYYDRDIYGAEDLNQNGEWIYTASYGYVWRPYASVTSRYADWSPYRYGHWRWVSPYGWTWINDEPWGWATYHHGRWVWDNGYWYWSPYGYYRHRRSWWSPALVVLAVYDNNVCWYPLPYRYRRHDYNRRDRRNNQNPGPVAGNPTPTPNASPVPGGGTIRRGNNGRLPIDSVPTTAVIFVKQEEFGRTRGGGRMPSVDISRAVLSKMPDETTPPIMPSFEERKLPSEIRSERRSFPQPVQTGAAPRKLDAPMDAELQKSRIYGNRPPLQTTPVVTPGINPGQERETKRTGAVERPPIIVREEPSKRSADSPPYMPPMPPAQTPKQRETPTYEPPTRTEAPRYEPPQKETPRYEPPPQRQETPRYEPPPRNDPPPKSDPPPSKSEPSKPSESAPTRKGKDG